MKNKKIKLYLKKKMDFIEKYAQIILISSEPEAIHQLRVGYKKLRAFLRLVKLSSSAEKGFVIPSTLRAIYVCAGRVRDLQIYFYKISSFYNKSDSYPRLVLHQIAEARYMLLMVLKTFILMLP
jgi:CHAD domain-containing protein